MDKIILILSGCLWGLSNVLIENNSFSRYESKTDKSKNITTNIFNLLIQIYNNFILNIYFIGSFLIGQLGSVLFYYCLGTSMNITTVTITANSLSILSCFILEIGIKIRNSFYNNNKNDINIKDILGMLLGIILIISGVYFIINE